MYLLNSSCDYPIPDSTHPAYHPVAPPPPPPEPDHKKGGHGHDEKKGKKGSKEKEAPPPPKPVDLNAGEPTHAAIHDYWQTWEAHQTEKEPSDWDEEGMVIEYKPRLELDAFKNACVIALGEHVALLILELDKLGAFNEKSEQLAELTPTKLRTINVALARWSAMVAAEDTDVIKQLQEHCASGYPVEDDEDDEPEPEPVKAAPVKEKAGKK